MSMPGLVIVGGSIAGLRVAESAIAAGYAAPITVIGREEWAPYSRPALSKGVLVGSAQAESTFADVADLPVTWLRGVAAVGLDRGRSEVVTDNGRHVAYDHLAICTGLRSRALPIPGAELDQVRYLRTLDDARCLAEDLRKATRVVIVGAGFVGCEVASVARSLDVDVVLVDPEEVPLLGALGQKVGREMAELHRRHGVDLRLGRAVVNVARGDGRAMEVTLDDGSLLEADLVVVGIGGVPETEWLSGSGFDLVDGVLCDSRGVVRGSNGRVIAVGDVSRWSRGGAGNSRRIEHFSNIAGQADVAVQALMDPSSAATLDTPPSVMSEQHRAKLQIIGSPGSAERVELETLEPEGAAWVATYWQGDAMVGAASLNATGRLLKLRTQVRVEEPVIWSPGPTEAGTG